MTMSQARNKYTGYSAVSYIRCNDFLGDVNAIRRRNRRQNQSQSPSRRRIRLL